MLLGESNTFTIIQRMYTLGSQVVEFMVELYLLFKVLGWGCAYGSLQTIVSWFKIQQYTSIDVPSHWEIHETLVEIGEKDTSFIWSREWIGAIELSFVLDKLFGVNLLHFLSCIVLDMYALM